MTEEEIHAAAEEILKSMEDVPLGRLTLTEALFLFKHCMRRAYDNPTIVSAFNADDLLELIEISQAVAARTGPNAKH